MKIVTIIRKDLGMSSGKLSTQADHAVFMLGVMQDRKNRKVNDKYIKSGSKKATLKVGSKDALLKLRELAKANKLNHYLVTDAGKTEIPSGTVTVLAIGPASEAKIDAITGSLNLYR